MEAIFETERLRVREFRPEDAQRMYEVHAEEGVRKWFPNEYYADIAEAEDAARFFADCTARKALPYVLAVETKADGVLIGDTGINGVDGIEGEVEIGYVISEESGGQGLASELVSAMTQFVLSAFDINVLYGRVFHGNDASARVLEKNGYVFVREEFGAEDDPYGNGMLVFKYVKKS